LDPFPFAEDLEIIGTPLPETVGPWLPHPSRFSIGGEMRAAFLANDSFSTSMTTDGFSRSGFSDRQMNVLRHHHIADNYKSRTASHWFKDFERKRVGAAPVEVMITPLAGGVIKKTLLV
jgi:hypothetical protein